MKKTFFSLFTLVVLWSCSSKNQDTSDKGNDPSDVVNVTIDTTVPTDSSFVYTNALELPEFIGFTDFGGGLISDDFGFHILQDDKEGKTVFLFDELAGYDKDGIPSWMLLDTLQVKGTDLNIGWAGNVEKNGKIDPEIMVLLPENTDREAERYTDIVRAWRFNRKNKTIDEISIEGLVCNNDMYSID
ncbi:hypothetical protein [Coprobacter tertius]|uniref:Lipoprotein n=1 Tax=Coprobacter tertius TaxID=2944915 RepID=A0ABT1MIV6_9BACT|nr:hypothetical protein [Coprobacter tertius]MCP9612559.1 hypothetical protein [Coprobacter tertius]